MSTFSEIAEGMDVPTLRQATRDCLIWRIGQLERVHGPFFEMLTSTTEQHQDRQEAFRAAGTALIGEVSKRFARMVTIQPAGTMSRMYSDDGSMVDDLTTIEALVTFRSEENCAHAHDRNGKLIAQLSDARVEWIRAGSIGITGIEVGEHGGVPRRQAWYYVPPSI